MSRVCTPSSVGHPVAPLTGSQAPPGCCSTQAEDQCCEPYVTTPASLTAQFSLLGFPHLSKCEGFGIRPPEPEVCDSDCVTAGQSKPQDLPLPDRCASESDLEPPSSSQKPRRAGVVGAACPSWLPPGRWREQERWSRQGCYCRPMALGGGEEPQRSHFPSKAGCESGPAISRREKVGVGDQQSPGNGSGEMLLTSTVVRGHARTGDALAERPP